MRKWTKEEDQFILDNYLEMPNEEIANYLGKTKSSVSHRACRLGIKSKSPESWSESDDIFLKENFGSKTAEYIAKELNRTKGSVSARIIKLRLSTKINKSWSDKEDNFLIDNHLKISNKEIAIQLGRTTSSVTNRITTLHLGQPEYFAENEDIFLKNNYITMSHKEMAQHLNRKWQSVAGRCFKLGLNKDPHKVYSKDEILRFNFTKTPKDILELAYEFNVSYSSICQTMKRYGHKKCRLSNTLHKMKSRCYNPKDKFYYNYGGRGILICEEWLSDDRKFVEWAINNGYSEDLTIDRIDNNGIYSPANCRWVDAKVQSNNRRTNRLITAFGETKTLSQWAEDPRCSVPYGTLNSRIQRGLLDRLTAEQLITLEQRQSRKIKKEQNVNI